jgi:hypothetical protein
MMFHRGDQDPVRFQHGISLFVSMILLAAITVLLLVSARTTLLELTMAGNEQQRITAFERAQSGIDALYEGRQVSIDFNTNVGDRVCTANTPGDTSCLRKNLALPADDFDEKNWAWVMRTGEAALVCPPAFLEISCTDAKAAFFEFRSQFDARVAGGGNSSLTQGTLSILPEQQ